MKVELLIPLLITTVVGITGWYIAHILSMRRTNSMRVGELVTKYQIDAYRVLITGAADGLHSEEEFNAFRKAMNDIMLFGNDEQIRIAKEIFSSMEDAKTFTVGPLLIRLRNDLRKSLKLSQAEDWAGMRISWDKPK